MSILIVLTNHSELGNTGKKTGWYLPEVAHPYYVFKENHLNVTICSPNGGVAPMDPGSAEAFKEDTICQKLLADDDVMKQINNTAHIKDVDTSKYNAIFFAGGHGPMWDLPENELTNGAAAKIYEANGIVSAVCHGTVGLLNTKLSNGTHLINGHKITSFTDAEEIAVGLMEVMPFALETKLKENGGDFVGADNFHPNVQVSGNVITGQNPASATGTAEAIVKRLKELQA